MSVRPLPDHPSLRHLRNEAKTLRRFVLDVDADAIALMREHLPKLEGQSDQQIASLGLSLQKIQHALARSYGFEGWSELVDRGLLSAPDGGEVLLGDRVEAFLRHSSVRW